MDFNWFQDKGAIEAFKKSDKGYLLDIEKYKNMVPFGQVQFTLRTHAGRVTDLIVTHIGRRIRYNLKKGGDENGENS